MRKLFVRTSCVVVLLSLIGAAEAAPFVNLDFEQAIISPPGSPFIMAGPAFPGWTLAIDGEPEEIVYYNVHGFGEPYIALYDQPASDFGIALLQGQYMAVIESRPTGAEPATLSQFGDVPPDARSIRVYADGFRGPPLVVINDVVIPMVFVGGSSGAGRVGIFAGDITASAGLNAELTLKSVSLPRGVDNVFFSTQPIPEPTLSCMTMCLLALSRYARTVLFARASHERRHERRMP